MLYDEKNRARVKVAALASASVATAALFGYAFALSLGAPDAASAALAAAALVLWMAVAAVSAPFIRSRKALLSVAVASTLAVWTFSALKFSPFTLIGAGLVAVSLYLAARQVHARIDNALRIDFRRVSMRGIRLATGSLALFVALYLVGAAHAHDLIVPPNAFDIFVRGIGDGVAYFIPGFSVDASVNDTLELIVASQTPDDAAPSAVSQFVLELKTAVSDALGVAISGSERVADVLYASFTDRIETLSPGAKAIVLVSLGLVALWILRGAAFLLSWGILLLANVLYALLLAFGFASVVHEERRKEIILL